MAKEEGDAQMLQFTRVNTTVSVGRSERVSALLEERHVQEQFWSPMYKMGGIKLNKGAEDLVLQET